MELHKPINIADMTKGDIKDFMWYLSSFGSYIHVEGDTVEARLISHAN